MEPADALDVREYLESVYGDYLEVAFRASLRSRRPILKFIRLLSRRKPMDYLTMRAAMAYFELRYRGSMSALVLG